jgi:mannosyltransferase OCH1-like enzyme
VRPEVRERLRVPAERSDLLRLEVVARYGGVYADTDLEALQPLDPLLDDVELFAARFRDDSDDVRINNAIFGAVPQHPVLVRALAEVRPRASYGYDKKAVGPLFLDRMLQGSSATFFDRRLFYPWPLERDGAVTYHHQARTWKDAGGLRRSLATARRRRDAARREARVLEARLRLAANPDSLARHAAWKAFAARTRVLRTQRRLRKRSAPARDAARAALRPRWELLRAGALGLTRGRGGTTSVPRTIHHIRLEAPRDVDTARHRAWRLANPGWDVRVWTEADIPADARPELLERLRAPAERADLLRLDILRRHGGVVVDPNLGVRALASLLPDAACFAAATPGGEVSTALVGAVPGHPALDAAAAAQRPREWSGYDPDATGAGALARARAGGAEIALVRGFEDADTADTAADRAALLETLLAVESEHAQLEKRVAELLLQLDGAAS